MAQQQLHDARDVTGGRLPNSNYLTKTNTLLYRCPTCRDSTRHHFVLSAQTGAFSETGEPVYIDFWSCDECHDLDWRIHEEYFIPAGDSKRPARTPRRRKSRHHLTFVPADDPDPEQESEAT